MMQFTTQNEFNRYVADNQDDLKYWEVMNQAKDEGLNADEAIGYANLRAQIEEEYR